MAVAEAVEGTGKQMFMLYCLAVRTPMAGGIFSVLFAAHRSDLSGKQFLAWNALISPPVDNE